MGEVEGGEGREKDEQREGEIGEGEEEGEEERGREEIDGGGGRVLVVGVR